MTLIQAGDLESHNVVNSEGSHPESGAAILDLILANEPQNTISQFRRLYVYLDLLNGFYRKAE